MIAPIIVSELLDRKQMVVVLCAGSTGSRIETENTIKTLKGYEIIANKRQAPVICFYRENSVTQSRSAVDTQLKDFITHLLVLFSGQNRELDSADLRNFLNYNKVTSYEPSLTSVEVFHGEIELQRGEVLVSLATLTNENVSADTATHPEYQCVGIISPARAEVYGMQEMPVHTCTVAGHFNAIINRLDSRVAEFDNVRKTIINKSIASGVHGATDDGVVL